MSRKPKATITDKLGRTRSATRSSWGKIRTLPSGRYQASYVEGECRYTAPRTFDTKGDAETWLSSQRAAISAGTWKSPATIEAERIEAEKRAAAERFALYAQTWLDQRVSSKGQPLRPKTRREYERQLTRGLATFADDRLAAITPARVRAWHAGRMKAGATAAGAESRLLRAIMNTAVSDGIIASNPVPGALTRTRTGIEHRPPSLAELGVILDAIGPRFRLAVLLAAYGNLRLSEWRALRRRDVTIVDGRVLIDVHRQAQFVARVGWVVGPPKSAEGVRIVPLPSPLTAEVEAHLAEQVGPFPDDLIFPPTGRAPFMSDKPWTAAWDVAREAAGVRVATAWDADGKPTAWVSQVREHDLRGFALTAFSVAGGTLRETQKFGGHATVDAAMMYQTAAEDRLAEIVDRMPIPAVGERPKVTPIRKSAPGA